MPMQMHRTIYSVSNQIRMNARSIRQSYYP